MGDIRRGNGTGDGGGGYLIDLLSHVAASSHSSGALRFDLFVGSNMAERT
jgi:hypothetical protein